MTQLNIPYNFQNQTTSDASQVDQNFNAVANVVNGKLADDNITPNSLTSASVATEGIVASDTKNLVYAQDLFSSSFIISGGVATKNGTNANQIDVTSPILGWVKQSDNTFRRLSVAVTNYKTTIASTTYYLDLGADGIVYWAQTHPSVNYATIATVTSDASSNVNVITDTRSLTNVPLSNYLRTDAGAPNPQTVANNVSFNNTVTVGTINGNNAGGAGLDIQTDNSMDVWIGRSAGGLQYKASTKELIVAGNVTANSLNGWSLSKINWSPNFVVPVNTNTAITTSLTGLPTGATVYHLSILTNGVNIQVTGNGSTFTAVYTGTGYPTLASASLSNGTLTLGFTNTSGTTSVTVNTVVGSVM